MSSQMLSSLPEPALPTQTLPTEPRPGPHSWLSRVSLSVEACPLLLFLDLISLQEYKGPGVGIFFFLFNEKQTIKTTQAWKTIGVATPR